MKSRSRKKEKSELVEELEVQQKALKKIIEALEERDPSSDGKEIQTSKSHKNEKT